eukprot:COSAG04_NODE_1795_length_5563_cov_9.186493_7_plen_143_part_00
MLSRGSGLNLCCGTAAEGLEDPATELCPLVKYFAERKKIFNIHFRNVRCTPLTWSLRPCQRRGSDHAWLSRQVVGGHDKGTGLPDFSEVWPDEGDVGAPASHPPPQLRQTEAGLPHSVCLCRCFAHPSLLVAKDVSCLRVRE